MAWRNPFVPLTQEGKYWLGFIAADGNISGGLYPRLTLKLQIGDLDHLRRFASFLGAPSPCVFTQTGRSKPQAKVAKRSRELYDTLEEYGITPHKSKTLTVPALLSQSPHFWRGYFDGDGSVWTYRNTLYMELCNGTPEILEQWCAFVHPFTGPMTVRKMSKNHNAYRARVGGPKAVAALASMVPSGTSILLGRKWQRAPLNLQGLLSLLADPTRR